MIKNNYIVDATKIKKPVINCRAFAKINGNYYQLDRKGNHKISLLKIKLDWRKNE